MILTLTASVLMTFAYGQNPCSGFEAHFTTETLAPAGGVHFTNTSLTNGSTTVIYNWSFGNGTSSVEKSPFCVYNVEGTYPVKLTITDQNGCESVIEENVIFSYGGQ